MFHVATLKTVPVADRWPGELGELGEPAHASANAATPIAMSLERCLTLAV